MKLSLIKIEGLRKIKDTTIFLGDSTFLIGENNVGKSTVLTAIRFLLKNESVVDDDFTKYYDSEVNENKKAVSKIVLTAEFEEVPDEAKNWIGFRGRIIKNGEKAFIRYRKTYELPGKPNIEMYQQKKELKEGVKEGTKVSIASLIRSGINEKIVRDYFQNINDNDNLNVNSHKIELEDFYEAWDYKDEFEWVRNPGGIPQNVMSKLPKLIYIPAEHKADEIGCDKSSALGDVMATIFSDIIESSINYDKVKEYFNELGKEIDTTNQNTEFGRLMEKVNQTIKGIFPDSQIFARVNLSDPSNFLKPQYDIKLGSNILTNVDYQGTGMIRATAFSLLKFRENWRNTRDRDLRSLIICFEEPEIFLHPNASSQMRDTIYELAESDNQIICTTHSPYMIDLSRERKKQILNNMLLDQQGFSISKAFNVTEEYLKLLVDDRTYIKMLIKIDDYVAKVFFAKRVIIVEGDTEEVVIKRSLDLLDKSYKDRISADFQIIKARGKATIPPLVKYLKAIGIVNIFVIHDKDTGKPKAEEVNPRILEALNSVENDRMMLEECIEDVLGYVDPQCDKPYIAFKLVENWENYNDIPEKWLNVMKRAFEGYMPD